MAFEGALNLHAKQMAAAKMAPLAPPQGTNPPPQQAPSQGKGSPPLAKPKPPQLSAEAPLQVNPQVEPPPGALPPHMQTFTIYPKPQLFCLERGVELAGPGYKPPPPQLMTAPKRPQPEHKRPPSKQPPDFTKASPGQTAMPPLKAPPVQSHGSLGNPLKPPPPQPVNKPPPQKAPLQKARSVSELIRFYDVLSSPPAP